MSDYKNQKAAKVKPEEIAPQILDNENSQNLINFVTFLRENKLTPRWASYNSWSVRYKNMGLCYVKIDQNNKSWDVRLERSFFDEYDKYITDDKMKNFILSIINPPMCKDRECWKRKDESIFGQTFDEVCRCWSFKIDNPDAESIESIKSLVLISKEITDKIKGVG